jgi:hypothetical protein
MGLGRYLLVLAALSAGAFRVSPRTASSHRCNTVVRGTPPVVTAAASPDIIKAALISTASAFKQAQEAKWEAEAAENTFAQADDTGRGDELSGDGELGRLRNETVSLIEELALLNPTPVPLAGWGEPGCPLEGTWRLLFTTGADATFRKTNSTGRAVTFQKIDSRRRTFVNCVDFSSPGAKLRGFRVVVKGVRLSDTEVQLKFRRVRLLRRSRWLRALILPLPPSWFLRGVAKIASKGKATPSPRGAGFTMLYLDEDIRCHKTFDGQYFVQQRCRYQYR